MDQEGCYLLSLASKWLLRYSDGKMVCSNTEKLYTWFIASANSVKFRCSLSMLKIKWNLVMSLAVGKDTQSRIAHTDVLQNQSRKFIHRTFSVSINPTPPLLFPLYHPPSSLFSLLALRG